MGFPVVAGRSPELDVDDVAEVLESWPLRSLWISSLPAEVRSGIGRKGYIISSLDGRSVDVGGSRFAQEARRLLSEGGWSAFDLQQFLRRDAVFESNWSYDCNLGVPSKEATGEVLDGWGSLVIQVDGPDLPDVLSSSESVGQILGHVRRVVPAVGALFAYAQFMVGDQQRGPDYRKPWTGGRLVRDPDWVPAVHWITLIPPKVLDRLGGLDAVKADAPVSRVEGLRCRDQRLAALLVGAPGPTDFDDAERPALEAYLAPVLGVESSAGIGDLPAGGRS